MTFSIVACSADKADFGVAVASKFLAVGAVVPAAAAGVGAIATQSYANLAYRPQGLDQLRAGRSADEVLASLTAADAKRESRQAGIVDAAGQAASFTGSECHEWAGGVTGDGHAIQGNILTGADVVAEMERAWRESDPAEPLARRLLAALTAGDAAGGDRRGRQSAALLVVKPEGGYGIASDDGEPASDRPNPGPAAGASYGHMGLGGGTDVFADLRVDDHPHPVEELGRLLDLHDLYFGKPDPASLLSLDGELAAEVRAHLAMMGHTGDDLDAVLAGWAGIENYEERLVAGKIDPLVLEKLRAAASPARS